MDLKPNERVDDLLCHGLKIIQREDAFRFSTDAVLLSHFVSLKQGDKVIDLGAGGGVIPLLLADREPKLEIVGLEIQEELLDMARRSVELNGLTSRIRMVAGDLTKASTLFGPRSFTVVVSNPPYLPAGEGHISPVPTVATARHELKMTLAELIREAAMILVPKGRLAMVHRSSRLTDILTEMRRWRLEPKRLRFVHSKEDKPAIRILIEGVKEGKQGLEVLPPLIIYQQNGQYTKEVEHIYFGRAGET